MKGLFLLILGWMRPLVTRLGADANQVQAIVALKITLDNRRTYTAFSQQQYKQKDRSNSFWLMLLMYGVMGIFGMAMLMSVYNQAPLFALSLSFAIPMMLIAMALISDFSSVLLDSSDNSIILPCPVTSRTLLVARLVHICLYLLLMSVASSLASTISIAIRFSLPMALIYFAFILLSAMLVIFLTSLVYLLLMRFTSEEKLREVITYMQIIVAIFFYAGYQLLPRMISSTSSTFVEMNVQWWHYLLPPVWLGGAMEAMLTLTFDPTHLALIALSVLTPFVGLWITITYLTPLYNQRISSIDVDARSTTVVTPGSTPGQSWADKLAGWLTQNPLEAAGFTLTWRTMLRDRQFKLRAYPAIGYMVVLFFMFFWRSGPMFSGMSDDEQPGSSFMSILPLYLCSLLLGNAINLLRFSDQHKAAWVYAATPLTEPGSVLMGSIKAAVMQLLFPIQLIVSAIILYMGGWDVLDDVLLTACVNFFIALLYATGNGYYLPFSSPIGQMNKGANVVRTLVIMLIIGFLGLAHWGLTFVPYGVWLGIPVVATGAYFFVRRIRQTGWEKFILE